MVLLYEMLVWRDAIVWFSNQWFSNQKGRSEASKARGKRGKTSLQTSDTVVSPPFPTRGETIQRNNSKHLLCCWKTHGETIDDIALEWEWNTRETLSCWHILIGSWKKYLYTRTKDALQRNLDFDFRNDMKSFNFPLFSWIFFNGLKCCRN